MKPYRVGVWLCALALLAVGAAPAEAAWDNVFQVCCHSCNSRPSLFGRSSNYCCPQPTTCCAPVCTTQYVQRCYYQPVTCYQTKTYYEPVTTYRTSYYYEAVTSYRYSCYYDPCTCSYQQVACPQTCYRLRSQCCPVTSYLQRCCQVPVTSYRLSYYYEPVTTCAAPACPPACTPGVSEQSSQPTAPMQQPTPGVYEQRTPAPGNGSNGTYDRYYPQPAQPNPAPATQPPPMTNNSYRQMAPAAPPSPPPTVKLDRIVAVPQPDRDVKLASR